MDGSSCSLQSAPTERKNRKQCKTGNTRAACDETQKGRLDELAGVRDDGEAEILRLREAAARYGANVQVPGLWPGRGCGMSTLARSHCHGSSGSRILFVILWLGGLQLAHDGVGKQILVPGIQFGRGMLMLRLMLMLRWWWCSRQTVQRGAHEMQGAGDAMQ